MSTDSVWETTIRILDEIIEDPEDPEQPASVTALLHPLGFICFPLERDGVSGVCLHAWDEDLWQGLPRASLTTSPFHSHSWDLDSYVVYGTVCNKAIKVSDNVAQPEYRIAEIRSNGDIDTITPTERLVDSTVLTTESYSGGETYSLEAGVFHTTEVVGAAATLAFGRGSPGIVDLALAGLDVVPHTIPRMRCDRAATVRFARAIRTRITEPERFRCWDDHRHRPGTDCCRGVPFQ